MSKSLTCSCCDRTYTIDENYRQRVARKKRAFTQLREELRAWRLTEAEKEGYSREYGMLTVDCYISDDVIDTVFDMATTDPRADVQTLYTYVKNRKEKDGKILDEYQVDQCAKDAERYGEAVFAIARKYFPSSGGVADLPTDAERDVNDHPDDDE